MVRRSQFSMEFVVSVLMFLSMIVLVILSFTKSYIEYAGQYQTENVYILSERYLQSLLAKSAPDDWVDDPYAATDISLAVNGTLNHTFVKAFGAMNYPHVRGLLGSRDFNLQITYLPSLSVAPVRYQSYPAGTLMMAADVADMDGNPVNATVHAVIVPAIGRTSVVEATYGNGRHFWSFPNVTSGGHHVTVLAFDGIRYGMADFEVVVR